MRLAVLLLFVLLPTCLAAAAAEEVVVALSEAPGDEDTLNVDVTVSGLLDVVPSVDRCAVCLYAAGDMRLRCDPLRELFERRWTVLRRHLDHRTDGAPVVVAARLRCYGDSDDGPEPGRPVVVEAFSNTVETHAPAAAAAAGLDVRGGGQARIANSRHGPLLHFSADALFGGSLELFGEWEEASARLLSSVIRAGDLAVDVGAHVGSFSVVLARAVGPLGRVVAVEPAGATYNALSGNLAINGIGNVHAVRAISAATAGRQVPVARLQTAGPDVNMMAASFVLTDEGVLGGGGGNSLDLSAAADDGGADTVPTTTVDALVAGACPAVVKVDVEGMEVQVLSGATATLRDCAPVVWAENQCASSSGALFALLDEAGYAAYWDVSRYAPPNGRGTRPTAAAAGDVARTGTDGWSVNVLAIRRDDARSALVLADVLPELTPWRPGADNIEDYPPEAVRVRDSGGKSTGEFGVVLQMGGC